jgi:hypothetical protein
MAIAKMITDRRTAENLGEEGLAVLRAHLFAGDCQRCNRPLGSEPPSLVVDEMTPEMAWARLHHRRCRPARWNTGQVMVIEGLGDTVSWSARALIFPMRIGILPFLPRPSRQTRYPALLVNPGLECVIMEKGERGWRPGLEAWFTGNGLHAVPWDLRKSMALPGASGQIYDKSITVALSVSPNPYGAPADQETLALAGATGGFLLMATHAFKPGDLTSGPHADLMKAIAAGDVLGGWVALDNSRQRDSRGGNVL